MAESFLFNIAERVLEKIAHLSVEEARLAFNFESHLRKLKETLSRIKAVLLDAERQQHQNEKLRLSMWKLRDIFYDAEDVIDDFKCEALRKQVVNHPNITFKVRFLASCSLPLSFSLKMGHKIEVINQRLNELAIEWDNFNLGQVNSQSYVIDENVRHLSFCDDKLLKVPQDLKKLKNVRTVFVHELSTESKTIHESIINLCVSKFKYLRALHLRCSPLTALPNLIGTLKHLRDLDLTGCRNIQKLSSSFYKLRSLQTLRMYGIPLMQLPVSMESLIELRYLEITIKAKHVKETWLQCWAFLQYLGLFECDNLECLPEGMQYLTSLRRLVLFGCPNLVSLPRSLKHLTKLEVLRISCCEKINL
ncbi:hypothetical protein PVK06_048004 [Gossypium arboreum]|uniref:Rx N-terminal domain-containing protein n=1 Tax=Gossypium arboreum TaxID=29729 RepID=A0ABR0MER9_GOSAR|nr:hypothetical protein PVK06_048004 [Gossypium arboreum]